MKHRIEIPEIPELNKGILVEVEGRQIALFNVKGTLFAIDDECPHAGWKLSEGELHTDRALPHQVRQKESRYQLHSEPTARLMEAGEPWLVPSAYRTGLLEPDSRRQPLRKKVQFQLKERKGFGQEEFLGSLQTHQAEHL